MITGVIETFAICRLYHFGHFLKKIVARLTEHDDVIKPLLRGAPRLSLALGPAPARAGPGVTFHENVKLSDYVASAGPKCDNYNEICLGEE